MSFPLFNKILLTPFIVIALSVIVLSVYMEPWSNELTRMGGYLENDYGWNKPQEHFPQPLFKRALSPSDYNKYFDIVVVGDSFSENESYGWLNYLAKYSGLTIISFNMTSIPLNEVLSSSTYLHSPPKLFIYESVERNIIDRHDSCEPTLNSDFIQSSAPTIKIKPMEITTGEVVRNQENNLIKNLKFRPTINFIKKAMYRELLGINITEVHRFELSRNDLFSSTEKDSVLVITRDFKLKGVSEEQVRLAQCSLLSLQRRVRTHKTEFIALIFPDKTTVYSDYLLDRSYANMSIVKTLENTEGLNIVKLVDKFKNAVSKGIVDFYLPADTHCGYVAYKMAAESTMSKLNDLIKAK